MRRRVGGRGTMITATTTSTISQHGQETRTGQGRPDRSSRPGRPLRFLPHPAPRSVQQVSPEVARQRPLCVWNRSPASPGAWKCGAIGPGSVGVRAGCGVAVVVHAPSAQARPPRPGPSGTVRSRATLPGRAGVGNHLGDVDTDVGAEVGLVDDEQVGAGDARAALAGDVTAPATSRTKICASTSAGEKVAVRLSPPVSTRTTSNGAKSRSRSSTASRFW